MKAKLQHAKFMARSHILLTYTIHSLYMVWISIYESKHKLNRPPTLQHSQGVVRCSDVAHTQSGGKTDMELMRLKEASQRAGLIFFSNSDILGLDHAYRWRSKVLYFFMVKLCKEEGKQPVRHNNRRRHLPDF